MLFYRNPTFRSRRRSSSYSDAGQKTVERRSKRGQETVERGSKGGRKGVDRGTPLDDPPDDDPSLAKLDQSITNPLANYMLHSPQGFRNNPRGSEMVILRARGSVSDRGFYETRADHVHWSDDAPNRASSHARLRRRLRTEGEQGYDYKDGGVGGYGSVQSIRRAELGVYGPVEQTIGLVTPPFRHRPRTLGSSSLTRTRPAHGWKTTRCSSTTNDDYYEKGCTTASIIASSTGRASQLGRSSPERMRIMPTSYHRAGVETAEGYINSPLREGRCTYTPLAPTAAEKSVDQALMTRSAVKGMAKVHPEERHKYVLSHQPGVDSSSRQTKGRSSSPSPLLFEFVRDNVRFRRDLLETIRPRPKHWVQIHAQPIAPRSNNTR